tara:strand:+ start:153 stop:425 length:273 start_codon:yes stop_codon:yes gene_type:complete
MPEFPKPAQVKDAVFFLRVQHGNNCDGSCMIGECTCAVRIDWKAFFQLDKPKSRIGLVHYQILEKHYCMLRAQVANWETEKKRLAFLFPN